MKTLKKNNKGFSLVELIVVILIMAIIAVALAPQVMKWVGESKESADKNNIALIKSTVDAAVADFLAAGNKVEDAEEEFVLISAENKGICSETDGSAETTTSGILKFVKDTMNCPDDQMPVPQNAGEDMCFHVTITDTGAVEVDIVADPTTP